jgi:hypothetical protein
MLEREQLYHRTHKDLTRIPYRDSNNREFHLDQAMRVFNTAAAAEYATVSGGILADPPGTGKVSGLDRAQI